MYTDAKSNYSGLDKVTFIIALPCCNNISEKENIFIIRHETVMLQMLVSTIGCCYFVFATSHLQSMIPHISVYQYIGSPMYMGSNIVRRW